MIEQSGADRESEFPSLDFDLDVPTLGGQQARVVEFTKRKAKVGGRFLRSISHSVRRMYLARNFEGVPSRRFVLWSRDHVALVRRPDDGEDFVVFTASSAYRPDVRYAYGFLYLRWPDNSTSALKLSPADQVRVRQDYFYRPDLGSRLAKGWKERDWDE